MILRLSFYGVAVEIRSREKSLAAPIESLRLDFDRFVSQDAEEPPAIRIRLIPSRRAREVQPRGPRLFRTRACQVYGLGPTRICEYHWGPRVLSRTRKSRPDLRSFLVAADDPDEAYEIAYVAVLSAVGEELDALGYHRIHALGFLRDEKCVLLPLQSRGGKSSVAALMLADPRYRLFSDEIPLLRKGQVHPFPIRIALFPEVARMIGLPSDQLRSFRRKIFPEKLLLPIPGEKVPSARSLDLCLFPERFGGKIAFAIRWTWSVLWGLGTPQMAEYMLRSDNLIRLTRIALSRALTAVSVISRARLKSVRWESVPLRDKERIDTLLTTPEL